MPQWSKESLQGLFWALLILLTLFVYEATGFDTTAFRYLGY